MPDRKDFLVEIEKLTPGQFKQWVFLSGIPQKYLPQDVSPVEQAIIVYQHAEQRDNGLADLQLCLDDVLLKPLPGDNGRFACFRAWLARLLGIKRAGLIPPSDPVNITRLPAPMSEKIGRSTELAILTRALKNTQVKLLHIDAPGGEGKSALVYYWLKQLESKDFQGARKIFAWSFDASQADSRAFFKAALVFFGRPLGKDEEAMAHELIAALQQQPGILILDNLEHFQSAVDVNNGRLHNHGLLEFFDELQKPGKYPQPFLLISLSRQALAELDKWPSADYRTVRVPPLSPPEGAALLQQLGARGEAEAASREWGGHALSIVLLGKVLREDYGGDLARRDELSAQALLYGRDGKSSEHARRIVGFYSEHYWLRKDKTDPGAVFMELLGIFDHPATVEEMDRLVARADHAKPLRELGLKAWNQVKSDLQRAGLLLPAAGARTVWDCHALVRQEFGAHFQDTYPADYRQANRVLYEYYQGLPAKHLPETKDELAPLYRAMRHGCYAGDYERVLELYTERISRRDKNGKLEHYSQNKLGAYSQELAALRAFFPQGWTVPPRELPEADQAWLLSTASFCLMSLGRLAEAIPLYEAVLNLYEKQRNWKNASIAAQNLVTLLLPLGKLNEAAQAARRALEYAEQAPPSGLAVLEQAPGGDLFLRMASHATLATSLHRQGQHAAARRQFERAEVLQAQYDGSQWLYSVSGFRYCAFLLEVDANEFAPTAQDIAQQVLQRGKNILAIGQQTIFLLDIALGHLTLARARRRLKETEAARRHYDLALHGIREAGNIDNLPEFLIDYADFLLAQGEPKDADKLLDEARTVIERGGMKLYEADWYWLKGRQAEEYRAEAERLAAALGYCSPYAEVPATASFPPGEGQ